ncbi:MAG: DUF3040 domain-containing protein [Actinomycetota bacterium]|nr:DUF3040 domain-containing protein [Actinomycetota bacterium]
MPLSEEELRLLEQMEQALAAEDPKFASALQGRSLRRPGRLRALVAAVVFLAGIALLMVGAIAALTWLGIIGFLVMVASATVGLAAWRGHRAPAESSTQRESHEVPGEQAAFSVIDGGKSSRRPRRTRKTTGTFMQRMEQRWQRRRDRGY